MILKPKIKLTKAAIKRRVRQIARSKDIRNEVGKIVVDDIRNTNYGTPAPMTIDLREYYSKYNKTHPKYKLKKINITFTGELLDDLQKNVKAEFKDGKISYILEHSNKSHKPYKQASDSIKGKSPQVTSLRTRRTRGVDDKFSKNYYEESYYDRKTGTMKTRRRQVKVPYKFISIQLRKRLGYNYFNMSDKTMLKIKNTISKLIIKTLRKSPKK